MDTIASQITSLTIVYLTVYSGADQGKHQSSASLAFVRVIHRGPHKWPVTRKMFPFDDVIMFARICLSLYPFVCRPEIHTTLVKIPIVLRLIGLDLQDQI